MNTQILLTSLLYAIFGLLYLSTLKKHQTEKLNGKKNVDWQISNAKARAFFLILTAITLLFIAIQ